MHNHKTHKQDPRMRIWQQLYEDGKTPVCWLCEEPLDAVGPEDLNIHATAEKKKGKRVHVLVCAACDARFVKARS